MAISQLTALLSALASRRTRNVRTDHRGVATAATVRERLAWAASASIASASDAAIYFYSIQACRPDHISRWNDGEIW